MPVTLENLPGDKVRVSTPGGVKAKATSFQKAMAQKRLLNAVEHSNWRPTGKKAMPMKKPTMKPMV
jgi:hypothetical protein